MIRIAEAVLLFQLSHISQSILCFVLGLPLVDPTPLDLIRVEGVRWVILWIMSKFVSSMTRLKIKGESGNFRSSSLRILRRDLGFLGKAE